MDFSNDTRKALAKKGQAMPDGAYPIRNVADLKRAIQAFGRSKNPDKTKRWIKRRARELGREDLIPEDWVKTHAASMDEGDFLEHYGIKGMRWGVRRSEAQLRKARAELDKAVKDYQKSPKRKKNIKKLSDAELNERIKRLENERKLGDLQKSEGEKMAADVLKGIGSKTLKTVGTGVAVYAGKQIVNQLLGEKAASFVPKPKK
jgi:hypothetical protein